jgi:hypothetical protein
MLDKQKLIERLKKEHEFELEKGLYYTSYVTRKIIEFIQSGDYDYIPIDHKSCPECIRENYYEDCPYCLRKIEELKNV